PVRVAESVAELGLKHAVITSVDRDDLRDGGAGIFARTIRAIRRRSPGTTIEVLTPDFQGDFNAVRTVVEARPDIFNHNTETVPRLYARIRPKAVYANSLALLRHVKALAPEMVTKSGLMVGLGETEDELLEVFRNMRAHNIDVLTVGQYLRPSKQHLLWDEAERQRRGVEVVWSDRGGEATYHGPGQLVGYPVLDLAHFDLTIPQYVERLGTSLIGYLRLLGIESEPGEPGFTGVW